MQEKGGVYRSLGFKECEDIRGIGNSVYELYETASRKYREEKFIGTWTNIEMSPYS